MEVLCLLFIVSVPLSTQCHVGDPCSDTVYRTINDLQKRSPSSFMNYGPICDYHLPTGWYGAKYYKMPTSPPTLGSCGTLYPFWLKGEHPPAGTVTDAAACKMGFANNCTETINIKVKNCTTFMVYHLKPVNLCNSAYCFELNKDCVSEVPSNLLVSYHNVTWEEIIIGVTTIYDPSVNLKCSFTPLTDASLFYEILWYEGDEVVMSHTLAYDSLENALLPLKYVLNKQKKAGSMIYCLVGAKHTKDGSACRTKSSPLFFAGIKILTPQLTIDRGGTANIKFQLTIPFAREIVKVNNDIMDNSCLFVALAEVHGNLSSCKTGSKNQCDFQVEAYSYEQREKYATDKWREIHIMKIHNSDDLDYKPKNRRLILRLQTGATKSQTNKLFDKIFLPNIQVDINEPDPAWKGKHCGSYTDPHMYTFDGYAYECQQEGFYLLYNNAKFNQEVQVRHRQCHSSYRYPRCTCAVAARSGRDIFTVDICMGKTFINFPLCEDKAFKVVKKNDKYYRVLFPTGTLVEILIVAWPRNTVFQIDVKIYPSPADVGNTNGLCGILDGKQQNDLTWRNNTVDNPKDFSYSNPPRGFYLSWKVPNNASLFIHKNIVPKNFVSISDTLTQACTCEELPENVTECNAYGKKARVNCTSGTLEHCKFQTGKPFECMLYPAGSKRKKRDLSHLIQIMESVAVDEKPINRMDRNRRQVHYDVRTHDEAKDVCIKAFEESKAFTTCRQYVSDLSNSAVDNCISDVMMTGDYNITRIHIEAALEQCSTLVTFNSTFQNEQPEVTHIIESLCPNNCSGNGECNEGNCTCDVNFAGSDCSFDVLGPPNIRHISDFGVCDKSYEECDEITLYGELFLEQMNTECYITRRTIQQNGTLLSETFLQRSLEPRTLFEGYCPLSYSNESHWVTEFTFNISNDGIRFTDNYDVYTYQSDCQEFKNTSGSISFTLKTGYCFINGRCYIDGGTNRDNQCDLCNVTLDRYSWSFNPGHCLINDECYINGAIKGINPCSACLSSVDRWNWSNNPGYCYIDDICYFEGQSKKNNDCYKCNYTLDRTGWTFNEGHCLIDGQCFKAGESHQINRCMMCDPNYNRNNWTMSRGYCFVNGSCLQNGESEKRNPCLICNISNSKYSLFPNPAYCDIDGLCVAHGLKNDDKSCLYCNTSINRESWSLTPGFCFVNDSCMPDGELDKTKKCFICNASASTHSLSPNPAFCYIGGVCVANGQENDAKSCFYCNTTINRESWSLHLGHCYIQERCFKDSEVNSTYPCQICNSSNEVFNFSSNLAYCNIDDLCVADGQKHDVKSCLYCNTSLSRENWSFNQDYCMINGSCIKHGSTEQNKDCRVCDAYTNYSVWQLKDGHCYIQETCFKDSDVNSTFPCQMCNSSKEVFQFSTNLAYCNIENLCVADGEKHDAKSCLYCNTSLSRESWSFNQDYCMINGSCIKNGSTETNRDCRVCDTFTNHNVWQIKDEHCYIQETCFKDLEVNVTFPCQICNPSNDVYEFSSNPDYCMINGSCIKHGSTEPNKDCRVCDTFTNHNVWQIKDEHCYIQETCFKDLEVNVTFPCQICNSSNDVYEFSSNPAYCNIGGLCVDDEQKNDAKSCLYCNTSFSRENWSFNQDYCMINGSCIKHGSIEPNKDCRVCDTFTNYSVWQIKDEHCYIQESCFKDLEVNLNFPCQICNSSNDVYEFSSNPAYCNIGGLCVADGQENNIKSCLICNTSLSRGNWSLGSDYCMINGNCVDNGKTEQGKECKVCDSFTNSSVWKIKDGYCYIQENCFKDFEINLEFPCQFCNSSNEMYGFSPNIECMSSAAEKTTNGSPFSNPIFIATVSLIGAIGVITILISIIYRLKTKLTKEWSIANEVSEGTTDGNVGLTVYKRINTED